MAGCSEVVGEDEGVSCGGAEGGATSDEVGFATVTKLEGVGELPASDVNFEKKSGTTLLVGVGSGAEVVDKPFAIDVNFEKKSGTTLLVSVGFGAELVDRPFSSDVNFEKKLESTLLLSVGSA